MWRPIQNTRPGIGWTISSADAETWDVEKKTSLYGTYHYDGFNKGNSKYTVQEEGIYRVNMQLRQDENGGGCMKVRVPPPHPLFLGWCVLCCRYSRLSDTRSSGRGSRTQQNPCEAVLVQTSSICIYLLRLHPTCMLMPAATCAILLMLAPHRTAPDTLGGK